MAVEFPDRYPLIRGEHDALIARKWRWFEVWLTVGERIGWWWPFIVWARRNGLADD